MGFKKAKYVIKSCKDCPAYRKKLETKCGDDPRDVYTFYEHYCCGQNVDVDELKREWFLKKGGFCILVNGDEMYNVDGCENNV
jgi:hypothetical protein